jgi:hypothetical protein
MEQEVEHKATVVEIGFTPSPSNIATMSTFLSSLPVFLLSVWQVQAVHILAIKGWPETHIRRQVTRHDCLLSLLGDGEKVSEKMYGDNMYGADKSSQSRTNISCTCTTSSTNQPKKDPCTH